MATTDAAMVESPLLDVREAAAYLRCKPCTIRKMIRTGVLSVVAPAHKHLILKSELDRWIKANQIRLVSRSKIGLTGT